MPKYSQGKLCLIEHCGRSRYTRGICKAHHKFISSVVARGERTWDEFEEFGMALPTAPGRQSFGLMRDQVYLMLDRKEAARKHRDLNK